MTTAVSTTGKASMSSVLHPGAAQAISKIEALGLGWTLEPNYDLSRLSVERRVQVRDSRNYAPKFMVERYAAQMDETAFPPILVTLDEWIVDGNTRVGARKKQNKTGSAGMHDALVIEVEYATASPSVQNDLHRLGAEMNSMNGKPLAKDEQGKAVRAALQASTAHQDIINGLGVSKRTIQNIQKAINAEDRLIGMGVQIQLDPKTEKSPLRDTALTALGQDRIFLLNSDVFKAVAILARDASYDAAEIRELGDELAKIDGDAGKLARVQERSASDATKQRVENTRTTGRAKPALSAQLRQSLGIILRDDVRIENFVERNPGEPMDTHIERLRASVAILSEVLAQNVALRDSLSISTTSTSTVS